MRQNKAKAIANRAARKAHWKYRGFPGYYLEQQDLESVVDIQLWKVSSRLESIDEGLLYTMLYRKLVDYIRSVTRSIRVASPEDMPALVPIDTVHYDMVADKRPSALELLLDQELENVAWTYLVSPAVPLTALQREVLQLYFLDDRTLEDIAVHVGTKKSAVCNVLQRALACCRQETQVFKNRLPSNSRASIV